MGDCRILWIVFNDAPIDNFRVEIIGGGALACDAFGDLRLKPLLANVDLTRTLRTVEVRLFEAVEVDEHELTDTKPREVFHENGADAPAADDSDCQVRQYCLTVFTPQLDCRVLLGAINAGQRCAIPSSSLSNGQRRTINRWADETHTVGMCDYMVVTPVPCRFVYAHRPVPIGVRDGSAERGTDREAVAVIFVDACCGRGVDTTFANSARLSVNPDKPAIEIPRTGYGAFVILFTELVTDAWSPLETSPAELPPKSDRKRRWSVSPSPESDPFHCRSSLDSGWTTSSTM